VRSKGFPGYDDMLPDVQDLLFLKRGLGISLSFERKLDHLSGLVLSRLKFPFSDSVLPRDSFSLSGLAAGGQSTEVIEPWVQSAVGIPSSTVIRDVVPRMGMRPGVNPAESFASQTPANESNRTSYARDEEERYGSFRRYRTFPQSECVAH
jgi:hypothetical protein